MALTYKNPTMIGKTNLTQIISLNNANYNETYMNTNNNPETLKILNEQLSKIP